MRSRAFLATVAILVATACGGADKSAPSTGVVPTAAPFTTVPSPTVVTGTATPTPSATPTTNAEQTYTVVAGDVLGSIANKFDVPSAQIRALNNLATDTLQIGQKLRIPPKSAANPPSAAPASGVTTYTVKQGDTAFGIALQFDTTTEALEKANSVPKGGLDNLQLGQIVKLPAPGQR